MFMLGLIFRAVKQEVAGDNTGETKEDTDITRKVNIYFQII